MEGKLCPYQGVREWKSKTHSAREGGDTTEFTRLRLQTWGSRAGLQQGVEATGLQQGVEATLSRQLLSCFMFAAGRL